MAHIYDDRHPSTQEKLRWFEHAHLPEHLATVSEACSDLAEEMAQVLPDHPQLTLGLQHLVEAKDCFVRAAIVKHEQAQARTALADADDG